MDQQHSIRLGVNIDHVATLRQQRGTRYPDVLRAARLAVASGADLITVHLREDRRHIQDDDVYAIRRQLQVPLNLEMAATEEMLQIALQVRPDWVCLVPERRQELTTEGGLDGHARQQELTTVCTRLAAAGIKLSLFIAADAQQIQAAADIGASAIELHTGDYAGAAGSQRVAELQRLQQATSLASSLGLGVHAGHGLTLDNVGPVAALKEISELNIGHALIAEAVFCGLQRAIADMRAAMDLARANDHANKL
ncbi:MAG: pyridoxine 5'-phosphate synthase [Gammaproteobacteria bacterium]|jgi:pyridoxine 5-phosphate synthase|nr:pyridoxine 5'-phosphate synthase [Gammaproteobacteria bacterium]